MAEKAGIGQPQDPGCGPAPAIGLGLSVFAGDGCNERIVLESLFRNPYLRVSDVASMCDIHVSIAGRLVDGLVDRGILREVTGNTGNKRNRLFVSDGIMDIIDQYR